MIFLWTGIEVRVAHLEGGVCTRTCEEAERGDIVPRQCSGRGGPLIPGDTVLSAPFIWKSPNTQSWGGGMDIRPHLGLELSGHC